MAIKYTHILCGALHFEPPFKHIALLQKQTFDQMYFFFI